MMEPIHIVLADSLQFKLSMLPIVTPTAPVHNNLQRFTIIVRHNNKQFRGEYSSVQQINKVCPDRQHPGLDFLKGYYLIIERMLTGEKYPNEQLQYFFCDAPADEWQRSVSELHTAFVLTRTDSNNLHKNLFLGFKTTDFYGVQFRFFIVLKQEPLELQTQDEVIIRLNQANENLRSQISTLTRDLAALRLVVESIVPSIPQPHQVQFSRGSLPFLFGVLSRHGDRCGQDAQGLTSELDTWYNKGAQAMFQLLCGCHQHASPTEYAAFAIPAEIKFLQGSSGSFQYIYQHSVRAATYESQYPRAMIGVLFIKNNGNTAVNLTVEVCGSSGWSSGYEGQSLWHGTPNADNSNHASISSITWVNAQSITQNVAKTAPTTVTVPIAANKTVAVMYYTSGHLISTYGNRVNFIAHAWYMNNLRAQLTNGNLAIDYERTHRALQCTGSSQDFSIWN